MNKTRLEAFSDGVLAIIITIMVLELKPPHGGGIAELTPLIPVFLSYVLSFIYVGIYWNNHHHLLHATKKITGSILWANLHLLFWLSLIPFVTAWMGENKFAQVPVALYGIILFGSATAYYILFKTIVKQSENSKLLSMVKSDFKEKLSVILYAVAIPIAFYQEWIAGAIYTTVALIWLIPDTRIEHNLDKSN